MIKYFIYTLFFLFQTTNAKAQLSYIDSLLQELENSKHDTIKIDLLTALSQYYSDSKPDSSVYFAEQRVTLTRKLNLKLEEVDASVFVAYGSVNVGNYPQALEYLLNALKIAENPESEKTAWHLSKDLTPRKARLVGLAAVHLQLGNVYRSIGNIEQQLHHLKQCEKISTEIEDMSLLSFAHIQLGLTYLSQGKQDSALFFELRALEHKANDYTNKYRGKILNTIGLIYFNKGNYRLSRQYLSEAIQESQGQNNLQSLAEAYLYFSSLLSKTGDSDSSLWYARKGLHIFQSTGSLYGLKDAYTTLSEVFKVRNNLDSAFVYQGLAMVAKDSMTNTEKVKRFQNIGFNEQLRLLELQEEKIKTQNKIRTYSLLAGIAVFMLITFLLFRNNRHRKKANELLNKQKREIEQQKKNVEQTLVELKATQSQLIQSEKMASLGELTAGIAHEIQNPLNFVNNFSEVSTELVDEMNTELDKGNTADAKQIAQDLKQNLEKINHHGKRAGDIVKGMLQHSSSGSGKKELTNINKLADEYLRLAYHGLRAKDKSFNATMKTDFDETIGNISIIPQDIGRVILNLINNAFYAAPLPPQGGFLDPDYKHNPTVWVSTKKVGDKVFISVRDNGQGIPQKILDKIFQPFFTTKPTGQGTGLGLSLAYDIVTKGHGGQLTVETEQGIGTTFIIQLPTQQLL